MHAGKSISRFGDGEFRLCLGIKSISQIPDPQIYTELRHILKSGSDEKCLVGIPPVNDPEVSEGVKNFYASHKRKEFFSLPDPAKLYHSSYISRPNFKPQFYTNEFHERVIDLWRGKDVLVVGSKHHGDGNPTSLRPARMPESKSVEMVYGPWRDAYAEIDRLESEVLAKTHDGPVLLCLGAAATVLAWRLAQKGVLAWDLGHIGQYVHRWRSSGTIYKEKKNVPASN